MNNIETAYDQIKKFNLIAGVLTNEHHEATLDGIELQLNLCQEEVNEAYDAFTDGNAEGLLQEACDMFVTASGLLQRLEAAGMNVPKALARVNATNLTKFPTPQECLAAEDGLLPDGATGCSTPYGHVVFKRNTDGKVMKPTNFVKVSMVGCVPEDFFGNTEEIA